MARSETRGRSLNWLIVCALFCSLLTLAIAGRAPGKDGAAPQKPSTACQRKQSPARLDGRCSYVCPKNSCTKPGRACIDEIGDCGCLPGYMLDVKRQLCLVDTAECVRKQPGNTPGCRFRCPLHSCIRHGRGCVDGPEDCECSSGYRMESGRCVPTDGIAVAGAGSQGTATGRSWEAVPWAPGSGPAPESDPSLTQHGNDLHREQEKAPNVGGFGTERRGSAIRMSVQSTSRVVQDLGSEADDPQDHVSAAMMDLVLLGTQLSIFLAFLRGVMYLWHTYLGESKTLRSWCYAVRCGLARLLAGAAAALREVSREQSAASSSSMTPLMTSQEA